MKKEYVNPEIEVIKIEGRQLLEGSPSVSMGEGNIGEGDIGAPDFNFDREVFGF